MLYDQTVVFHDTFYTETEITLATKQGSAFKSTVSVNVTLNVVHGNLHLSDKCLAPITKIG